jgi:hypothetical protein
VHERLTVYQASKRLGISESAVRQRVHRGTLESSKDENGRLVVHLTAPDNQHNGNMSAVISDDTSALTSEYIDSLKSQVESLEQDKEHLREESVRKDAIIMSLTQRIPVIEAPAAGGEDAAEARESAVMDFADSSNGAAATVPQESVDGQTKQPWWKRLFQ